MAKRIKPIKGMIKNVGGHMINPPENCGHRKKWIDNAVWVDLCCCFALCPAKCKKYDWYLRATPNMRVRYLRRNGVYYPWDA